jgi:hypothetical protein
MTNEKAREFFSAYQEGALEPGLQQALQQKLRTDRELAADYAAFEETMRELDAMKFEEIDVPMSLSSKIATRIDTISDRRTAKAPVWASWLRGIAMGGVAAAAIFFVGASLMNARSNVPVAAGDFSSSMELDKDHLNFASRGGRVILQYTPTGAKTVIVSSGLTGREIQRFPLDGNHLESALENNLPDTALFDVQVLGEAQQATIALPGSTVSHEKSGSGDIKKFAMALAGFYRVPVVLEVSALAKPVSWQFTGTDARSAATAAVGSEGYSVDQRSSDMITIMDR